MGLSKEKSWGGGENKSNGLLANGGVSLITKLSIGLSRCNGSSNITRTPKEREKNLKANKKKMMKPIECAQLSIVFLSSLFWT